MPSISLEKCRDRDVVKKVRSKCFGLIKQNKCTILKDTKFKDNVCPFYKSVEDYEAGILKYGAPIIGDYEK